jgi:hypothetical protein
MTMHRTSPLTRLRTALTLAAIASGSFALAVACSHSAPPPKEPTTLSNRSEPEGTGGDAYGILGMLYGGYLGDYTYGGAFASLTGTGDFSSGFDDTDIYGGLLGNEAGEMYGGFGFGTAGIGYGGGGTGWGTIGTGRYGTLGHGSGTGTGYGTGGGGMRSGPATVPQVKLGNASTTGDLDKNIIRRYIRRKLPDLEDCYVQRLLAEPALQGTVTTEFTINADGTTSAASASGLHPDVERCVVKVLESIVYPKPKGGGTVKVSYPFSFTPTGG